MKKLIAGLMLLLIFVNAESAVKGVSPDAKTMSLIKKTGADIAQFLDTKNVDSGWYLDGKKRSMRTDVPVKIYVDENNVLTNLGLYLDGRTKNEVIVTSLEPASGRVKWVYIFNKDKDGELQVFKINGYWPVYSRGGSLAGLVDPNDNDVEIQ